MKAEAITRICLVVTLALLATGASPANRTEAQPDPLSGVSLAAMRYDGDLFSETLEDGRRVIFTVDPELQHYADSLFDKYDVPAGAAVIINSKTGRVLTMASHRSKKYAAASDLVALDPTPPAASLFKIVTTSALLEKSDTTLKTRTCYHGGGQRLQEHNLEDSEKYDTACATLANAFGRSINSIFAKLSDRKLTRADINTYARGFRFGKEIPFDVPVPVSPIDIPAERLERARTAAGFWHSHLSPLHAAVMAQTIAQDGAMLRPYVVDHIDDSNGEVLYESKPAFIGRPIQPETAAAVREAMKKTVSRGTARKSFKDPRGVPYLGDIAVGGKTGTLHGHSPFRAYSWFVGVAPIDEPEISIAVLVVNDPKWRIKSAQLSAMLLRKYFEDRL